MQPETSPRPNSSEAMRRSLRHSGWGVAAEDGGCTEHKLPVDEEDAVV
jgi:hypothetical protein